MNDFLRIYVIWAPARDEASSKHAADIIAKHFDGIGMERDGVAYRVPVRFRSEPWRAGSILPRPIDLSLAEHNAIVLLHDQFMHQDRSEWDAYISSLKGEMGRRGDVDIYIPFGSPTGEPPLPSEKLIQYVYRRKWATSLATGEQRDTRLLLHVVFTIRHQLREMLQPGLTPEKLFVSHAKADGDNVAQAIVDYVNDTSQDVPLKTFYDAKELIPGLDFQKAFQREIGQGTLLAIVSDVYDSRPWCVFELTTAKRSRRPIVLADVGRIRTSRTYPYGANVPKLRVAETGGAWIEPLLVETLSEGLRCDLVAAQGARLLAAAGISASDALILPRPPELFDLADAKALPENIVYPDPPLAKLEQEILNNALSVLSPTSKLLTLAEVR